MSQLAPPPAAGFTGTPRPAGAVVPPGRIRDGQVKRADIQALRALAVGLVLLFHLQPDTLSGGYVGVDVFFVISGFLITSHLLRSPPLRARDLVSFWSRRVARLLPAALVVLAATLAASRMVAPATQWKETADEVLAAGFYVANWHFADQAVDYLAADDLPSPVQHYWSLSVEEQFYAVWPVLLMLLFALGALLRCRRGIVLAGLVSVTVASLAWSVHLTEQDPARAYFVTPTRVWELGVGGVLAAAVMYAGPRVAPRPEAGMNGLRSVVGGAGFAAITWSAWTYTAATPFPGWHALVPVLGGAAVIAAAPRGAFGRALGARPVQYLGDISYSVYLWHWPVIVLLPSATGRELTLVDKVGVLVVTLALASATKRWIEDPFLRPRTTRPVAARFVAAALGMAILVGLVAVQNAEVREHRSAAQAELSRSVGEPCFGAAALANPRCLAFSAAPGAGTVAQAALDKPQAYPDVEGGRDCFSYLPDFRPVRCDFGVGKPRRTIALVGNSHAGHWLPALQELAAARGWRVTTFLASQCALADVPQQFATGSQTEACRAWVRRTSADVAAGGFDAVVVSNRISVPVEGTSLERSLPEYGRGYREVLLRWEQAGIRVLGIRDTPAPGEGGLRSVPDCLAKTRDPDSCSGTRQAWLPPDPFVEAVASLRSPRIRIVDLTDRICGPSICDPAVGGVIVYFDGSHLTATYARSLARYLHPALTAVLRA